ncbi:hypothetical protein BH10ACI1_BH10ACI1_03050 [soil metagenome]
MPKRKKNKMNLITAKPEDNQFVEKVKELSEGLYYISETDAEVFPFEGTKAEAVTRENILSQTKNAPGAPVEERDFAEIFARLTAMQDWFGDEEKANAERFSALQKFLEDNLKDLKVFKIGSIQIDIYFVGLDTNGNLMGIQTKAVET